MFLVGSYLLGFRAGGLCQVHAIVEASSSIPFSAPVGIGHKSKLSKDPHGNLKNFYDTLYDPIDLLLVKPHTSEI